jgi:hypothetical protein
LFGEDALPGDRQDCRAMSKAIAPQHLPDLNSLEASGQLRERDECEYHPQQIKQQVADQNYFWQSNSSAKGLAL